ncbi:MAG: hypothetical protein FJ095_17925 [Deltaproteobacteria bacterium]|nr:hypothetical protein [Deltaproteobacteria bacterium]
MRRLARSALVTALLLAGCSAPPPRAPGPPEPALAVRFDRALQRESVDPSDPAPYLDAIDAALLRWNDPWATPVVAAALERLVWPTGELPRAIDHALVHRSRSGFVEVARRLSLAHARAERHPILGPMLALSLHELALETGAEPEAASLRHRGGCVPEALVAGPLAWPPLSSLDGPSALSSLGPLPGRVEGLPPFVSEAPVERVAADACAYDFEATGTATGLRALVVDAFVPRDGWVYVSLAGRSPLVAELGGTVVLRRVLDVTAGTAVSVGRAWVERGRVRLVVRVAPAEREERVTLQLVTEDGAPLATVVPKAGEVASARASRAASIELVPEARSVEESLTAASAELALGLDRRAARRLEAGGASASPAPHVARLRARAARVSEERHEPILSAELASLAAQVHAAHPQSWEARLAHARALVDKRGEDAGTFAALEALGIVAPPTPLPADRRAPELAALATMANDANLRDLAQAALEALEAKAPGSALAAMVDAEVRARVGAEDVRASCEGGLSRGTSTCLTALVEVGDLHGTLRELARLRRLRGSPSLFRKLEQNRLVAHGEIERAARLYEAMPPAQRDTSVLAVLEPAEARRRLLRDAPVLGDAPFGMEPLARLVGAVPDPAPELVAEGRRLVAADRASAFLPDAGTAVLRHLERYELTERGQLTYLTYDLRRVSDTEDVATGAEADEPRVVGRWTTRVLRRTIHKRDGRVLDPDPNARGSQGHTDLSQLEKGDYVERLVVGWALPDDHGHLVVDGPDLMPERTSVREASIELVRPERVPMSVWSHALLGAGATTSQDGQRLTVWKVGEQAPRRLEPDVPELESRVSVSFGTDETARLGRAIGEHLARLDDAGDDMRRWVAGVLGPDASELSPRARIARLTAAVGKAVREPDPRALGDHLAAFAGGAAEPARVILERGAGSRTWVLTRALREAGIDSTVAVAETRPYAASPSLPAHLGRFTHPLVRARLGEEVVWLDVDVPGPPLPPGRVSPELRGRMALLPNGTVVQVDASSAEDADLIEINLALDASGDARGTFRAALHGRAAQEVARALETLVGESRTHLLRSLVLGWVPWADVRDVSLTSGEGAWQVSVSARIAASHLADVEDRSGAGFAIPGIEPFHVVLPRPSASSLSARYAPEADRQSALAVDTPLLYRVTRRILLPDGAVVSALAPPLEVRGAGVVAGRSVSVEGASLEERFEVNLPVGVVEGDGLPRFASELRAIDDGFAHATRARLAPAAAGAPVTGKPPRREPAKRAPTPPRPRGKAAPRR